MDELKAIEEYPEVSFIDFYTLSQLNSEMLQWFREKKKELTGEDVTLSSGDDRRLILLTCAYYLYQGYMFIDEGGNLETLIAESEASNELTMQIAEEALKNSSIATGFIYDSRKQKARISNIEGSVLAQYVATLTTGKGAKGSDGTYTGPGSTYDKFIKALKNAKVDLVIADKQEQLDEWLALKG